ncbi:hypothetical protein BJ912DRAFT_965095 [Pholiota molesta]|nr:hypothetical protein BJ912DRAFT_965095 [Pholiota molesta]
MAANLEHPALVPVILDRVVEQGIRQVLEHDFIARRAAVKTAALVVISESPVAAGVYPAFCDALELAAFGTRMLAGFDAFGRVEHADIGIIFEALRYGIRFGVLRPYQRRAALNLHELMSEEQRRILFFNEWYIRHVFVAATHGPENPIIVDGADNEMEQSDGRDDISDNIPDLASVSDSGDEDDIYLGFAARHGSRTIYIDDDV